MNVKCPLNLICLPDEDFPDECSNEEYCRQLSIPWKLVYKHEPLFWYTNLFDYESKNLKILVVKDTQNYRILYNQRVLKDLTNNGWKKAVELPYKYYFDGKIYQKVIIRSHPRGYYQASPLPYLYKNNCLVVTQTILPKARFAKAEKLPFEYGYSQKEKCNILTVTKSINYRRCDLKSEFSSIEINKYFARVNYNIIYSIAVRLPLYKPHHFDYYYINKEIESALDYNCFKIDDARVEYSGWDGYYYCFECPIVECYVDFDDENEIETEAENETIGYFYFDYCLNFIELEIE